MKDQYNLKTGKDANDGQHDYINIWIANDYFFLMWIGKG